MAKTADIVGIGAAEEVKQWTYKARNREGKEVTGNAKAVAKTDVTNELMARGLTPLAVKSAEGMSLNGEISIRKTPKTRSLVLASSMLAAMLDSGLSYTEALDVVINDCEDMPLKNGLTEVRIAVQNGSSLSGAMAQHPVVFPAMMINLVTAGEAAGTVKDAMNRVAESFDADDKLRAKVKKAMMYPMVVFIISNIIFGFLMLVLVPKFAATFEDLGGEMPKLTQMVVGASGILKYAMPGFFLTAIPGFIWYRQNSHKPQIREFVDPLKLKMPIFGNLFHKIALARFTRTLSGLMDAGVERLESLTITAETVGNVTMARAIVAARDAQRQGKPLIDPLKAEPLFPAMVISMVEAGEKSGNTGFMLGKAADIYDRDVDQITDNMSALIEPLFLVFLGVIVGTIVIAIYLPYLSIGEAINNS